MAQPQPIVTNQQINFWDAVIAGDITSAVALIKTGADVNGLDTRPVAGPNGRRPLNYAAIRNDTAMITALLNEGANINLANRSGFTPLHHAAEAGSTEAATLLIAKGANLTARNVRQQTVVLIAKGANLTARNVRQQTVEQIATVTHHADISKILHQAVTPAQ